MDNTIYQLTAARKYLTEMMRTLPTEVQDIREETVKRIAKLDHVTVYYIDRLIENVEEAV